VQRPLTSGPRRWPSGPTLQPLTGRLHDDTLYEAVTGNPKLKVGGGRTPWPAGLGRLATTWRVIDLTKSVTPPWTPINTLYQSKSTHPTLFIVLHL
jgi:hypothetical protein